MSNVDITEQEIELLKSVDKDQVLLYLALASFINNKYVNENIAEPSWRNVAEKLNCKLDKDLLRWNGNQLEKVGLVKRIRVWGNRTGSLAWEFLLRKT
tara:strand:+ start:2959 stop:3252 length:294 start_codon:yes stop_codon:yes gene_type:complete